MLPQRYLFFSIVVQLNQKKCRFIFVTTNYSSLITKKSAVLGRESALFAVELGGVEPPSKQSA